MIPNYLAPGQNLDPKSHTLLPCNVHPYKPNFTKSCAKRGSPWVIFSRKCTNPFAFFLVKTISGRCSKKFEIFGSKLAIIQGVILNIHSYEKLKMSSAEARIFTTFS